MPIGDAVEASSIGHLVRIKALAYSRKVAEAATAAAAAGVEEPRAAAAGESGASGRAAAKGTTNTTIFVEGCLSHVSKLSVVLLGFVEVDPDAAFAPKAIQSAEQSPAYVSTKFITVNRARIVAFTVLDAPCPLVQRRGGLINESRIVDQRSDAARHADPCGRRLRYQLLVALARMHFIRIVADERRLAAEAEVEQRSSVDIGGADAASTAASPVSPTRASEPISVTIEREDERTEVGGVDITTSGGEAAASPHSGHVRVLSTGSHTISADPARQLLFDAFVADERIAVQWERFHRAFCNPGVQSLSFVEAIEENQLDARSAQVRASLGVHSMLQLLSDARSEAESLVAAEQAYRSSSSRRRFSPYQLRLERIRSLFKRLFVVQSLCGIILTLCGGIQFSQAIVTPITDSGTLPIVYNPYIWEFSAPAAFTACLLGISMAITARWSGRISRRQHRIMIFGAVTTFALAVLCLIPTSMQSISGRDIDTRRTVAQFYENEVENSTRRLCLHMLSFRCSGWDRRCNPIVAEQEARALESSNGTKTLADFPTLHHDSRYCPKRCNEVVSSEIDIATSFQGTRPCGLDLEASVKSIAEEFIILMTISLGAIVLHYIGTQIGMLWFWRTIANDEMRLAAAAAAATAATGEQDGAGVAAGPAASPSAADTAAREPMSE